MFLSSIQYPCITKTLPMAALIKTIIGGKPYFYIAVSKRVNGQPRIVHQTCLGSVDRILATFQQQPAAIRPPPCRSQGPRPRPPRRPLAGRLGLRRPSRSRRRVDPAAPRPRPLPLPPARRLPPHLQPRPPNQSRRLVPAHRPAPPVGLPLQLLLLPSLRGPLRLHRRRPRPRARRARDRRRAARRPGRPAAGLPRPEPR